MNKPVYLRLSILELVKIFMYEFWYDYAKAEYGGKAKLCYIDTHIFTVYIKTDDIYKDIAEDVETRFDASNDELDKPLLKDKIKKVIGLKKNELDGKIITKYAGLKAKIQSYLKDHGKKNKNGTKTVCDKKET